VTCAHPSCWVCRPSRTVVSLHDIAPRLARARDSILWDRVRARRERGWLRDRVLDAERVLAHRELQLIRAGATGKRRDIRRRQRLLDEVRREVEYYRARLAEMELAA
jgi:hypothetical protein